MIRLRFWHWAVRFLAAINITYVVGQWTFPGFERELFPTPFFSKFLFWWVTLCSLALVLYATTEWLLVGRDRLIRDKRAVLLDTVFVLISFVLVAVSFLFAWITLTGFGFV